MLWKCVVGSWFFPTTQKKIFVRGNNKWSWYDGWETSWLSRLFNLVRCTVLYLASYTLVIYIFLSTHFILRIYDSDEKIFAEFFLSQKIKNPCLDREWYWEFHMYIFLLIHQYVQYPLTNECTVVWIAI